MKNKLRDYVSLPHQITPFERSYLAKLNRIALVLFALHVPAFAALAWFNGTGPNLAVVLTLAVLAGPVVAYRFLSNPRAVSTVHGIAAMFFGGLLVHFGQGPLQIEMHFYFFAVIAILAVFANPLVIIAAAVTVAAHHLALWFIVPRSVFNYDAPVWTVAVHAGFVVVESVAACYSARSFFDNVIGLERIVEARTGDLRLVLDNVDQGLGTADLKGNLATERSRAFRNWFGDASNLFDAFATLAPDFSEQLRVAWAALDEALLPLELLVDQLPKRFSSQDRHYEVAYNQIGASDKWLVVVTEVTARVHRERVEQERREVLHLFERALSDRRGVQDYVEEATHLVQAITRAEDGLSVLRRRLHTLKGNSAIFGVESVAGLCHDLETQIAEDGSAPSSPELSKLAERWAGVAESIERMVGDRKHVIELDADAHAHLEQEAMRHSGDLGEKVRSLRYEATKRRLSVFGDQVRRIATRFDKDVRVVIEDNALRLDPEKWSPFWSAFVHAIRNAVDHGIEHPETRVEARKQPTGQITLRTRMMGDRFLVEVADDGRGICWKSIREKAHASGLPALTSEDLQRAIFHDGLSTAREVTDLSGRGIGMGALLEATKALHGEISVFSVVGGGTTVQMSFPRAEMVYLDRAA